MSQTETFDFSLALKYLKDGFSLKRSIRRTPMGIETSTEKRIKDVSNIHSKNPNGD